MKEGLIRIKHQIDEDDHESYNIEYLKIYFDCDKGQYRHRFHCPSCDKLIDCYCFNDLSDAVSAAEEHEIYCENCWIHAQLSEFLYDDEEAQELIDKYEKTNIADSIQLVNMINFEEIYSRATPEYREQRVKELEDEINIVTHNLKKETLDKLHSYFMENVDYDDWGGSSCEM